MTATGCHLDIGHERLSGIETRAHCSAPSVCVYPIVQHLAACHWSVPVVSA